MPVIQLLPRLAISGAVAFVGIVLLEHALVPGFDPRHYTISEYANAGGFAGIAGSAALACWASSFLASGGVAVAVAASTSGSSVRWRALAALLLIAGGGLAVAAVWPTQAVRGVVPAGEQLRMPGRLHDLGSGIAQLAIFAAALVSARALAGHRLFRSATITLVVVGALVGPALAAVGAGDRGLRQRALVAGACAWELALVARLRARMAVTGDP